MQDCTITIDQQKLLPAVLVKTLAMMKKIINKKRGGGGGGKEGHYFAKMKQESGAQAPNQGSDQI